jgi:hypothetical protein
VHAGREFLERIAQSSLASFLGSRLCEQPVPSHANSHNGCSIAARRRIVKLYAQIQPCVFSLFAEAVTFFNVSSCHYHSQGIFLDVLTKHSLRENEGARPFWQIPETEGMLDPFDAPVKGVEIFLLLFLFLERRWDSR